MARSLPASTQVTASRLHCPHTPLASRGGTLVRYELADHLAAMSERLMIAHPLGERPSWVRSPGPLPVFYFTADCHRALAVPPRDTGRIGPRHHSAGRKPLCENRPEI